MSWKRFTNFTFHPKYNVLWTFIFHGTFKYSVFFSLLEHCLKLTKTSLTAFDYIFHPKYNIISTFILILYLKNVKIISFLVIITLYIDYNNASHGILLYFDPKYNVIEIFIFNKYSKNVKMSRFCAYNII